MWFSGHIFMFLLKAYKVLLQCATSIADILFGVKTKMPILVKENFTEKASVQVVEVNMMMQIMSRFKVAFVLGKDKTILRTLSEAYFPSDHTVQLTTAV